MKDYLERDLSIGDQVVFLTHTKTSSFLSLGIIEKFTKEKILIRDITGKKYFYNMKYDNITIRDKTKVVKI